jgi:hypothetical protein
MKNKFEIEMTVANLNDKYEIRKRDAGVPHIRLLYKRINPAEPPQSSGYIVTKEEIRPLRWVDYDFLFSGTTEEQIHRRKVIGASELELVHLPERPQIGKEKVIEQRDAEQKIRKGKSKATIGDIEKMIESKE